MSRDVGRFFASLSNNRTTTTYDGAHRLRPVSEGSRRAGDERAVKDLTDSLHVFAVKTPCAKYAQTRAPGFGTGRPFFGTGPDFWIHDDRADAIAVDNGEGWRQASEARWRRGADAVPTLSVLTIPGPPLSLP